MKLQISNEDLDLIVYALNMLIAHGEARSRRALPRKARELLAKLTTSTQAAANGSLADSGIARSLKADRCEPEGGQPERGLVDSGIARALKDRAER